MECKIATALVALLWVGGCNGEIVGPDAYAGAHSADPGRADPGRADPGQANPAEDTEAPDPNGNQTGAFSIDTSNIRLLPFDVRVRKLEAATGIARTDPAFAGLLGASIALGAPNHAAGVAADLSWSASRIATWVRHLRPICSSESLAPYASVDQFIERAHGRSAHEDEALIISNTLAEQGVDNADDQEFMTCLAVLSSAEFVLQ